MCFAVSMTTLAFASSNAVGQLSGGPYSLRPLDINSGGTTSTGGPYSISASTGQAGGVGRITTEPVFGPPQYQLDDGFWSAFVNVFPTTPMPDPAANADKCRFISCSIVEPASEGFAETAIRVRLVSLHHVIPPYTGGASVPFTSFEGQVRWVGPPVQYVESTSTPTPFYASSLQCDPHYQDWSTVGLLHVTGSAIVPSSVYEVENVAGSCMGVEASCTAVSAPLSISTTRWGDVETPYNPPSATVQPDVGDIGALVNKFRSAPGAPIKARALIAGNDAFGNITTLNVDLGFGHIAACVDAFRGVPYPYTIAVCP